MDVGPGSLKRVFTLLGGFRCNIGGYMWHTSDSHCDGVLEMDSLLQDEVVKGRGSQSLIIKWD